MFISTPMGWVIRALTGTTFTKNGSAGFSIRESGLALLILQNLLADLGLRLSQTRALVSQLKNSLVVRSHFFLNLKNATQSFVVADAAAVSPHHIQTR